MWLLLASVLVRGAGEPASTKQHSQAKGSSGLTANEPAANTAVLAPGGGGGRKASEIPRVMIRAPLWNFNPRQLMGGAPC